MAAVLGVDVGGSGIKARLLDADDRVLDVQRVPTPLPDPGAGRLGETIVGLVRRASAVAIEHGDRLGAVGVAVPGLVDDATGRVAWASNLGWRDVPVRDVLAAALAAQGLPLPLALGHDVRAGALGEVRSNQQARTADVVAFLAVGTGLACALVVHGRALAAGAAAGEIGHVRIGAGPHAGRIVEEVASAAAVARRCGVHDARAVADLVRAGQATALAAWQDCVAVLADCCAWLTAVGGCSVIIVGGGLAESGALLFDPLREALAARLDNLPVPDLVPARHADGAGSMGAALLARDLLAKAVR